MLLYYFETSKSQKLTLTELRRVVIYAVFCFDLTQGCMNGAANKIRTHSCRFFYQMKGGLRSQLCWIGACTEL